MTTALYRRYRPDTFDDVIGQEHVTEALKTALETSRVAHAFLFSGPRGCGKTTSARILARSLNCAEGPTPTPCGTCPSCVDLATGGPGSLDVVEIDAASHSGVDDARELREHVSYAPTRDRYRIFILDEAHMVTKEGFNALLKVVEEPPDHAKFIFATTEPEKVITTIRSRTHHYPFRLVGPGALMPYLKQLVDQEGVEVDEGVYPLIIRAGGGSVRDTLSTLDQLIAGSDGNVTTEQAVRLLGFTDEALLDATVEALGEGDGSKVFRIVEEIIEAGHEPRQFTTDLLQRLRDMMVCALAGERAADILVDVPSDVLALMQMEAQKWGTRTLSVRADMVEAALREMRVASAPRMQLELLLARLLVADQEPQVKAQRPETSPPRMPAPQMHRTQEGITGAPVSGASPSGAGSSGTGSSGTSSPGVGAPDSNLQAVRGPQVQRQEPPAPESQRPEVRGSADRSPRDSSQAVHRPDTRGSATSKPPIETPPSHPTPQASGGFEGGLPAPGKDQVRDKWFALLEAMKQFGSMYAALIEKDVRDVVAHGSTTHLFLQTETNVGRLKSRNGEEVLGKALTQIFGREIGAKVHSLQDLDKVKAGFEAKIEQSVERQEEPRAQDTVEASPPAKQAPPKAASPQDLEARDAGAPRSGSYPGQGARPSAPHPSEHASVPEEEEPPPPEDFEEPPPPEAVEVPQAPPVSKAPAVPQVKPQREPSSQPRQPVSDPNRAAETAGHDEDSRWRGRPPADIVLGILGGQVIEEEIVEEET